MRRKFFQLLVMALALVVGVFRVRAAEPSPLWKFDLTQSGYKPCIYKGQTATVHFVGHYLVVQWKPNRSLSHGEACGQGKEPVHMIDIDSLTAGKLVLDADTQKVSSAQALEDDGWEPLPETYPTSPEYQRPESGELARWKGMTLTVDGHNFYLQEPGKERSLVCAWSIEVWAQFVSPDRIWLSCFRCSPILGTCPSAPVVDKSGKKKYGLDDTLDWLYLVSNRPSTRFATYKQFQSGLKVVQFGTSKYGDRKEVTLFSSENGKQLFRYKWAERWVETGWPDHNHRVAISDDGSLLALVTDSELLLFRIPSDK